MDLDDRRPFEDRKMAGQELAARLRKYAGRSDVLVLALPRGGVPMGGVIAQAIGAELEIIVPRKIGHPTNDEYAIGALAEDGDVIWNERERALVPMDWQQQAIEKERAESQRRRSLYGQGRPRKSFAGRDVILVDDGIATGLTIRAAISTIQKENPKRISIAIPVAPQDSLDALNPYVDRIICLETPVFFGAIGSHYESFPQTTDQQVIDLMQKYL